ncbi:MAG: hypothetical protein ACI9YT_001193 [Halobacteriales archaeon]
MLLPTVPPGMRSDIPPDTVGVELADGGVAVEYTDDRETFYHGVPEPVTGSIRTPPEKEVHVLVTDPSGTEGVLTYVNDRKTHDDILRESGVGRVLLEGGEETELFPGVTVAVDGYAVVVSADHDVVDGRVFVFAEDATSEHRYELVPEE